MLVAAPSERLRCRSKYASVYVSEDIGVVAGAYGPVDTTITSPR
jgi:hypothetical protein